MRIRVCAADEIGPGTMKAVEPNGIPVLIANVGGRFLAISDVCSHARSRLSDGYLNEAECTVECATHNAVFSLTTGEALEFPADEPVEAYPVTVTNGDIHIDLPDDAS
jgi:3-phenylpropionate/trans-cinnamate dioxygenase ferredoxin subunit